MPTKLDVYRFDPETDQEAGRKQYEVDLPEYGTVLDGLLEIRDEQDGTLAISGDRAAALDFVSLFDIPKL